MKNTAPQATSIGGFHFTSLHSTVHSTVSNLTRLWDRQYALLMMFDDDEFISMINSSIDTRRPVQWDYVYSNNLPVAYATLAALAAPAAVAVPPAHPSAAKPPALWPAQPLTLAAALPARAAAAAAGAASRARPQSEWPPLRRGPCTGVWGLDFPVRVFTHEVIDGRYIECVKCNYISQLKNECDLTQNSIGIMR